MTIKTTASSRTELLDAIKEHFGTEPIYAGAPTFAYKVGPVSINRDQSIACDDDEVMQRLIPILRERGMLAPDLKTMEVMMPFEEATSESLRNLIFMLYSKQHLINRATGAETIGVPESLIQKLQTEQPTKKRDIIKMMLDSRGPNGLYGFVFKDDRVTITFPFYEKEPGRWMAYAELIRRMILAAKEAKRVTPVIQKEENEKYFMRAWLLRLGLGGAQFKTVRHVLMDKLKGHAAFANDEAAQKHKNKYAELRKTERTLRKGATKDGE